MRTYYQADPLLFTRIAVGMNTQPTPAPARRTRRLARRATGAALLAVTAVSLPTSAAPDNATLFATGATMPAAVVATRNSVWVSDHTMGFCKLVNGAIDQNSCVLGGATAPGQAVFRSTATDADPDAGNFYVPDLSSKSEGVYQYNYRNGVISNVRLLAPAARLGRNRPLAVAWGPDNKVYVTFKRNTNVLRIRPATDAVENVARSASSAPAMAFIGPTLYLAEAAGLTRINQAPGCTGGCRPQAAQGVGVPAPVYVTSDGAALYLADAKNVYRHVPADGCSARLAGGFTALSALGVGTEGADTVVYAADDPTAGNQILAASVYRTSYATASPPACTPGGGGTDAPAPLPAGATLLANGATNPTSLMQAGDSLWVSDHLLGFCRIEAGQIDQNSCVAGGAVSPAQSVFRPLQATATDPNPGVFYVPDEASASRGVYQYTYSGGRITAVTLLAPNAGLGGNGPQAVAWGPSGLYVANKRNNEILRIRLATGVVEKVGAASGRTGPPAMALIGTTLYLAEDTGLTKIANVDACTTGGCRASAVQGTGVVTPTFVAAQGQYLYIADSSAVYRFQPAQPSLGSTVLNTGFNGITAVGIGANAAGNVLYLGEDPTAGAAELQGRVSWIARPAP